MLQPRPTPTLFGGLKVMAVTLFLACVNPYGWNGQEMLTSTMENFRRATRGMCPRLTLCHKSDWVPGRRGVVLKLI